MQEAAVIMVMDCHPSHLGFSPTVADMSYCDMSYCYMVASIDHSDNSCTNSPEKSPVLHTQAVLDFLMRVLTVLNDVFLEIYSSASLSLPK